MSSQVTRVDPSVGECRALGHLMPWVSTSLDRPIRRPPYHPQVGHCVAVRCRVPLLVSIVPVPDGLVVRRPHADESCHRPGVQLGLAEEPVV